MFITATSLLATLSKARGRELADQIAFYAKPTLPSSTSWATCRSREADRQPIFFQLVSRRQERGSMLITTNQTITQWRLVFGDE